MLDLDPVGPQQPHTVGRPAIASALSSRTNATSSTVSPGG
jgi:hypothetical protein